MNNTICIIRNPLGTTKGIFYWLKVLSVFFLLGNSPLFSQPKLEVADAKKNFGFVDRGEIIKNEYVITNTGNQPLLITDIEISCSCTSAELPKEPILPGKNAKVLVIFNTTTVYGRQDRVVLLKSNDPHSPVKLRYKGFVKNKT